MGRSDERACEGIVGKGAHCNEQSSLVVDQERVLVVADVHDCGTEYPPARQTTSRRRRLRTPLHSLRT
jgi:hypothetical protein